MRRESAILQPIEQGGHPRALPISGGGRRRRQRNAAIRAQ
jgi:hypothetical protein